MSDLSDNETDTKNNNIPKRLSIDEELYLINNNIEHLKCELYRYITEVENLWTFHLKSFIDSSDCLTMDYIGINGYDKFVHLMKQQKIYRLMQISLKRLYQRKKILMK